ncbi:hypothetical protein EfaecalisJ3_13150, partial [Enterococcus faecalis]
RSNATN